MTISQKKAELLGIQAKLSNIVDNAKAAARDLTDDEARTIENGADRALQLKAEIRGLENAERMDSHMQGTGGDSIGSLNEDGRFEAVRSSRGYLSPASVKSATRSLAAPGIKALVAGGSNSSVLSLDEKPVALGQPSLGLLSVIPTVVRDTRQYSYLRQTTRTNNAAVVASGGLKPTSVFTVTEISNSLAVYAHLSESIDKFLLEDNRELETFLDVELNQGILQKVSAGAVAAFIGTVGIQTQAYSTSAADSVYLGASKVQDLGYSPDLVLVGRSNYDTMRLAKSTTNEYIGGAPFDGSNMNPLWGLNTVIVSGLAANTALVLDSSKVSISTDKHGIRTEWDAITGFANNLVRARTEGRFAFDVSIPAALALVTLTGV